MSAAFNDAVRRLARSKGYPVTDDEPVLVEMKKDAIVMCGEETCDFEVQLITIECGDYFEEFGDMYDQNGFTELLEILFALDDRDPWEAKAVTRTAYEADIHPIDAAAEYIENGEDAAISTWAFLGALKRRSR